ncbi:SRPBCC family protein [Amycolatopsis jejuensis]|uniref:SRPBCC family protein n=1 Tax=Amycolatopsis jejuensis TaxID=330084 RepID=UPI00068B0BC1|nr:SRPBCC family protein [Amycolatopsis jejuensis]
MPRWVESVERRIAASTDELYLLVANPVRHKDIDGSGALVGVTEVSTTGRPLGVGDTFSVAMDLRGKYTMTSTVIEAVPGRRFAWQSRPHRDSARWRFLFGGRILRYEFEPDGDHTLVRESWDLSEEPLRLLLFGFRRTARGSMRRTLDRMAALTGPRRVGG